MGLASSSIRVTVAFSLSLANTVLFALDKTQLPDAELILVKVAPLVYPPLARQTRIEGDVVIYVEVAPNGAVETSKVISGHPLLAETALGSSNLSQYECRNCPAEGWHGTFTYDFKLDPTDCVETTKDKPEQTTRMTQTGNHVMVSDWPRGFCAKPIPGTGASPQKIRSIRCLYLWRCGRPKLIGVE